MPLNLRPGSKTHGGRDICRNAQSKSGGSLCKTHYVAVERNYWTQFFGQRVAFIHVDEDWYLTRYPDVAKAVEDRLVPNARRHYCESGYFEHRMPYYISVDPDWYNEQYPDVREAIETHIFPSAQRHFELIGFREGRHPYPNFALRTANGQSS